MKTDITVYVFMELDWATDEHGNNDYYSNKVWTPTTWKCQVSDNEERIFVGKQVITIDAPENFDPRPQQIAALEEKKRQAEAAFTAMVTDINRQISELQAIEYTPEAA